MSQQAERRSSLPPNVTPIVQEPQEQKTTEVKRSSGDEVDEEKTTESDNKLAMESQSTDPEQIHYPPGRTILVGDIVRKPSVLEETSFNTDHLSPISDVSKAYTQRLSQLKSELGLDEMGNSSAEQKEDSKEEEQAPPRDEPERVESNSRPTFYQEEPDGSCDENAQKHKPMSDEALVDAMFNPVFEGESSEMASLAAASSSQTLNTQDRQGAEKSDDSGEHKQSSGFDDWYDNPTAPPSEENEVKDFVEEILSQSMDEAMFSASKSLRNKEQMKQEYLKHTDTSFDKKSHPDLEPDTSPSEEIKDPLIEAVFTSTIDKDQFMESVISYPASTSSSRVTSSVTTPGVNRTLDDSE
ncbi:unnamed protein product, partial [Strongylus vulgaris]